MPKVQISTGARDRPAFRRCTRPQLRAEGPDTGDPGQFSARTAVGYPTGTIQGKVRWKARDDALDANPLIDCFERLIKEADRKVFPFLDNPRVHHAKLFKVWLAEHQAQEEMLNADLKHAVTSKALARSKAMLEKAGCHQPLATTL